MSPFLQLELGFYLLCGYNNNNNKSATTLAQRMERMASY